MAWSSPYPPRPPPPPHPHPSPSPSPSSSSSYAPTAPRGPSPYPPLPPLAPAQRTSPSLSRSSTYLASLGPSRPPPSAPPTTTSFADAGMHGGGVNGAAGEWGFGAADGSRGWSGSSFSSSGARTNGSKPPVTGRPDLPHKSNSSPTPSLSSSNSGGNGNGSGAGRKLQKNRRASVQPPSSSSPASPAYPAAASFPAPYPYAAAPAPSRSPYPPYNAPPASAPTSPHLASSSSSFPSIMPPLTTVVSAPAGGAPYSATHSHALPSGPRRAPSSPYPPHPVQAFPTAPPPPPPGAGKVRRPNAGGEEEEERRRKRAQEEEARSPRRDTQLSCARQESLCAERARLASLAARDQALLDRTLEASAHERLRAEALERERERAEEAALRAAMEDSRREEEERRRRVEEAEREERGWVNGGDLLAESGAGKGKGKGRAVEEAAEGGEEEDIWAKREREALDLAMRLSMQESEHHRAGRVETSAEAFARLSRPRQAEAERAPSPNPHPLFEHPSASPPTASAAASSSSTANHTRYPSSSSSADAAHEDLPPPPAYEYPVHAPENDEPDDVIVGPGRPLPPPPPAPATAAGQVQPPMPPPGAAPATFHSPSHPSSSYNPSSSQPYPVYSRSSPPSTSTPSHSHHHPLFASASAFTADSYPPPSPVESLAPSTVLASAGSFASFASYASSDADDPPPPRAVQQQQPSPAAGAAPAAGAVMSSPEEVGAEEGDPFADEFSVAPADSAEEEEREPEQQQRQQQQHAREAPKDLFGAAWAARRASVAASLPSPPASAHHRSHSHSHPPPPTRRPPDLPLSSPSETATTSFSPRLSVVTDTGERSSSRGSSTASPSTATPGGASAEETPVAVTRRSPPLALFSVTSNSADASLLSPPPTASTSSTSTSASPLSTPSTAASFHSTPSHGGLVSVPSSLAPPLARSDVLDGVQWGFVDPERAAMHPPVEWAGEFPRAAQLSLAKDEGGEGQGRERYRCFAVEAKGWQSLLVYLMWHGNSRLEAAPSDLQLDKSNRGLQASLSLDFFRSFTTHAPRVRITLALLPLSHATPLSAAAAPNSPFSALPVDPPALESDCPSIRLALPAPLTLPLPLSAIATTLSHAHTASRQTLRVVEQGVIGGATFGGATGHSQLTARLLADRATLARAIDLFRKLNGERVEAPGRGVKVEDAEVSTLDRLKARLRRTKKVRVLEGGGGPGGGGTAATGGPLPEGAMLITPFSID
ncbi:hypothetical protein JCM6882_007243 [Rhodosporidiobolus microsporus]